MTDSPWANVAMNRHSALHQLLPTRSEAWGSPVRPCRRRFRPQRSATLSFCTNVDPLQPRCAKIFGSSVYETAVRPSPTAGS
jgi:hypothetical protein